MKIVTLQLLSLALLIGVPGLAAAEDSDDLGVTMSVVEDAQAVDEQDFVNEIELPEVVPKQAQSHAQMGTDTAAQARQQGKEFGMERAEEGRNRGHGGDNNGQPPVTPPVP